MKYLVVNADDFGYSKGVNKGIIEAHVNGIVTSTTVLVDGVAADEAKGLSTYPELSVGLHFNPIPGESLESEFGRQLELFKSIVGRDPDSIDTHKSLPSDKENIESMLRKYSEENDTPVRKLGKVKFIRSFFGLNVDGSGVLDENNVTVSALKSAIDEASDEVNEIMTHVGYCDEYLLSKSSYNTTREKELESVLDPSIKEYLASANLQLVNWGQLKNLGVHFQ